MVLLLDKLISDPYWYCHCKQKITNSLFFKSKCELSNFLVIKFCQYQIETLEFNRERTKLREFLNKKRQKSFNKRRKYVKFMVMIKVTKHFLKDILHDFNLEKENIYI